MRTEKKLFNTIKSVVFSLACLNGLFFSLNAQYYVTGQDPSNLRWRQIETQKFVLIYPDYYEAMAQKVANYCDTFAYFNYREMDIPIRKKQTKTPVVFHAVGSFSNGLSVWAPKRTEYWTCPPQDSYSQLWLQQLTLHEYRHELQMESLNQSATGVLTSVFGQHVIGAVAGLFVPMWYLEGDATWAETVLSRSGRGRQASFLASQRAILSTQEPFSYYKANFGSYKDFVPNDYVLGYLLIAYDRSRYGNLYWKKAYQRVPAKFWQLAPFYNKGNFKAQYDSAMVFWKTYWNEEFSLNDRGKRITQELQTYTNYYVVGRIESHTIMIKRSFKETSSFVQIDTNGEETKIAAIGNVYDNYATCSDSHIAWVESVPDKRWNVLYNNLVVSDIKMKNRIVLTRKRNLFSPAFSNKKQLAALEVLDCGKTRIVLFDSLCIEYAKVDLPENKQYSYPAWHPCQDSIFLISVDNNGSTILCVDIKNGTSVAVSEPTYHTLSHLKTKGDVLFYISDISGVDQVYGLIWEQGDVRQVAQSQFGVSSYWIEQNAITASYYTPKGYAVFMDTLLSTPALNMYNANALMISNISLPPLPEKDTLLPSKTYNIWDHMFNFHSWAPFSINPTKQEIDLGVSVFSQNIMSNSIFTGGFQWNTTEQKGNLYADYQLLRFYPILNTSLSFQGHEVHESEQMILYNELKWKIGAEIPFLFSYYNHYFSMSLHSEYGYSGFYFLDNSDIEFPNLQYAKISTSFVHYTEKPYQYMYSPWLQSIKISYSNSIGVTPTFHVFDVVTNLYFPSPIPTHSIRLYGGIQSCVRGVSGFSSSLRTARGFRYVNTTNVLASYQVNYTFPIAYPDWNWGWWVYLKRLSANIFYDGMFGIRGRDYQYSVGLECNAKCNFLLISTPVSIGLRTSYLPKMRNMAFDVLFSIDI